MALKYIVKSTRKANEVVSPAFRDRDAGSSRNQDKPVDDGLREDRHSNQIKGKKRRRAGSGIGLT